MRILNRNVYVGPSQYARFPVIRLELDLGALEQWPTAKLGNAFIDGLLAALPGLAEHGCSYREPGGFVRRMREGEGTWLGHVLEHVAIELQNVAGEDVTFGKTRSIDDQPEWLDDEHVLYQFTDARGLPEDAVNIWMSRVTRGAVEAPTRFIRAATSPAVVRR